MIVDATRVAACVVGLGAEVRVLGVDDPLVGPLVVHVETTNEPVCPGDCWTRPVAKDRQRVELVDLAVFGRPARLCWHKRRWACPNRGCHMVTWTEQNTRIAPARTSMTTRAGRWVTYQVGACARPVSDLATELGRSWHTINDAVIAYGDALLRADVERIGAVWALGLDETLFVRTGTYRSRSWVTSVVDVAEGRLLDLVEGRTAAAAGAWLAGRPQAWRDQIGYATLDLSGPYRAAFTKHLPDATQVADPFHVIRVATQALDEVRRRVQQETLGHRGRKGDPLYRIRRPLTMASERLDDDALTRLKGHLAAGDPHGEVRNAWHAREVVRFIYTDTHPDPAGFVAERADDLQDESCPPEINRVGRTIGKRRREIAAWHDARVTNGPTEAINGLNKRVKRAAFGMRVFKHYRIRALLYAGGVNWDLLATITPR
ncbi:MAG: ISL3 family transposase [Acidimicrobiia bacterium]|nr:ISL3 family transposase [Acidimicrobiia bacterium]